MSTKLREILATVLKFIVDDERLLESYLGYLEEPLDDKNLDELKRLLLDSLLTEDLHRRETNNNLNAVLEIVCNLTNRKVDLSIPMYEKVKFLRESLELLSNNYVILSVNDLNRLKINLTGFLDKLSMDIRDNETKRRIEEIVDLVRFSDESLFSEEVWKTIEEIVFSIEVEAEKEKRAFWESLKAILKDLTEAISSISYMEGEDVKSLEKYVDELEKVVEKGDLEQVIGEIKTIAGNIRNRIIKMGESFRAIRSQLETSYRIIDSLKIELERQRELSIVDELTKVYNRRGLMEVLKRELSAVRRYSSKLSISFIDFDDFKYINDNFGHTVGDKVLVSVVSLIKNALRSTDIIGRYGGDEFVVLLPRTSLDEAYKAMERISDEVKTKKFKIKDSYLKVSISIGLCEAKPDDDEESLISRLSSAVKRAKSEGKGKIIII